MLGAPAVALIGGFYVAELLNVGREGAIVAAAAMIAGVIAANAAGLKTTARLQLGLAGVLAALLLVAVLTALPETKAENWTPFAPHGWAAVGSAASVLMLSFIGWEAVSHLAGELPNPARQLPRAIFAALGIVVVLYLGLAAASVGVLGATPSRVPLADLMAAGLGETGRTVTAGLAVLLTMGTMNTYVAAVGEARGGAGRRGRSAEDARSPEQRARHVRARRRRPAHAAGDRRPEPRRADPRDERLVHRRLRHGDGGGRPPARREPRGSPPGSRSSPCVVVFAFSGWFVLVPIAISCAVPIAARRTMRRRRSRARATTAAASAGCP